jgi:hypothetical protein
MIWLRLKRGFNTRPTSIAETHRLTWTRDDAGGPAGSRGIDRKDAAVGDRALNEPGVGETVLMELGGVGRGAGDLPPSVHAFDGFTHAPRAGRLAGRGAR